MCKVIDFKNIAIDLARRIVKGDHKPTPRG